MTGSDTSGGPNFVAILIAGLSLLLVLTTVPFSLYLCVKVLLLASLLSTV